MSVPLQLRLDQQPRKRHYVLRSQKALLRRIDATGIFDAMNKASLDLGLIPVQVGPGRAVLLQCHENTGWFEVKYLVEKAK
jgi:hypothetical protein